jgi:hypothetical protein
MTSAASHVPTLRVKSLHFGPRASNSQEAARSDCRFRSPYLDATEQTMSDRSDSDFIQRPSSTLSGRPNFQKADIAVNSIGNRALFDHQMAAGVASLLLGNNPPSSP